jgi:hypothetical protein
MGSADSHRDFPRITSRLREAEEDQASETTITARGCYCTAASRGRLPKPRDCEAATTLGGVEPDNVPEFYQRGWVTRDQISAFTASANRREVSGELARYARLKGDPPKRTMTWSKRGS